MDSGFYTIGGLAVNVPMLEVLTSGLSLASAEELYVSSIMERFAGNLADEETVQKAIRSFAESLSQ